MRQFFFYNKEMVKGKKKDSLISSPNKAAITLLPNLSITNQALPIQTQHFIVSLTKINGVILCHVMKETVKLRKHKRYIFITQDMP